MTDRLPDYYTNAALIKRQMRREFWRCFVVGLLQFGGMVIALMVLVYSWMLARQ